MMCQVERPADRPTIKELMKGVMGRRQFQLRYPEAYENERQEFWNSVLEDVSTLTLPPWDDEVAEEELEPPYEDMDLVRDESAQRSPGIPRKQAGDVPDSPDSSGSFSATRRDSSSEDDGEKSSAFSFRRNLPVGVLGSSRGSSRVSKRPSKASKRTSRASKLTTPRGVRTVPTSTRTSPVSTSTTRATKHSSDITKEAQTNAPDVIQNTGVAPAPAEGVPAQFPPRRTERFPWDGAIRNRPSVVREPRVADQDNASGIMQNIGVAPALAEGVPAESQPRQSQRFPRDGARPNQPAPVVHEPRSADQFPWRQPSDSAGWAARVNQDMSAVLGGAQPRTDVSLGRGSIPRSARSGQAVPPRQGSSPRAAGVSKSRAKETNSPRFFGIFNWRPRRGIDDDVVMEAAPVVADAGMRPPQTREAAEERFTIPNAVRKMRQLTKTMRPGGRKRR